MIAKMKTVATCSFVRLSQFEEPYCVPNRYFSAKQFGLMTWLTLCKDTERVIRSKIVVFKRGWLFKKGVICYDLM